MKRFAATVLLLLAAPLALAAPPTAAQIDRLLEVTDARKMGEDMLKQADGWTRDFARSMLGENVSAADQARLDAVLTRQSAATRSAMSWDKMLPIYRKVYAETLTAEEVQAMTAFYSSPAGRSIMQKTPQLMQRTMQAMQPIMQELMQSARQTLESELKPVDVPAPATKK